MLLVRCANCAHPLRDEHETQCPKCGSSAKILNLEMHEGMGISGRDTARRLRTEKATVANRKLLAVLIAIVIAPCVPGYFLSGWLSVLTTLVFGVVSVFVGYFAITRVITKTYLDPPENS